LQSAKRARLGRRENPVSDEHDFDAKKFSDDLREHINREVNEHFGRERRGRKPIVVGIHLGKGADTGWGVFTGVLIALIGLGILLDNLHIFPATHLYRLWPMILVAFGLMYFFRQCSRVWGSILLLFGVLLQLDQFGVIHFSWGMFWGLACIALGFLVMWGSLVARRITLPKLQTGQDDLATTLSENVVFGAIERRLTTKDFRGGVVTAIFGGVELDLSEADMQQDQARLEVNAIFGGVELRVPQNWQVVSRGTPVFGGFVDKTRLRDSGDAADSQRKILVLTGSAIFGGVDVKN
jgi:predicted membrane protein